MIGGREAREAGESLRAFNTNHVHSCLFSFLLFYYCHAVKWVSQNLHVGNYPQQVAVVFEYLPGYPSLTLTTHLHLSYFS